ncbi:hypothetical protein [Alicyclobacillus ferrooxydans]|uniref:Uncharacterized protein n=1 Tax=Alicyclobacillus ferrooxydans TaxID=471514 RepID=A0A0P9CU88_9BACL|nr:hypothetical protein [Alicyclobacillus ferrooxydans]KPV43242.1 hypothetical protein AN477_13400 [Alicyclobacillus ferrooxydans]
MTLVETLLALMLFAMTGGAVADLWYQTAHAAFEVKVMGQLDDVADSYAEQVLASVWSDPEAFTSNSTSTWTSSDGQTYQMSVITDPHGGRKVVVTHAQETQSLYVTLPK